MNSITIVTAYTDNYIYLYQYSRTDAFVVDPGDAAPVLRVFETCRPPHMGLGPGPTLSMALATHHHFDHIEGIKELKNRTGCRIVGPDGDRIPAIDRVVKDADVIEAGDTRIQVIATPGHTRTSVCYYVLPSEDRSGVLFTGDTLFIGGCGRLLECDARTMWNSLVKIAALPGDTLVYPGHNYTRENHEFALTIEHNNDAVRECLQHTKEQRRLGSPAVPSTIAQEKQTNVFLRANAPQIKTALGIPGAGDAETFAELRRRKDAFG